MDTRDVLKEEIEYPVNTFKSIWGMQTELVERYQKIEGLPPYPLNLDLKSNQLLLKDLIARVTEELAEAYEEYIGDKNLTLVLEEMADAIHFLVEAMVFSGSLEDFNFLYTKEKDIDLIGEILKDPGLGFKEIPFTQKLWYITYYINIARNSLKNKPWKQTEMLAIKGPYFNDLLWGFKSLILTLHYEFGLSARGIYKIYFLKNRVNWFRIHSHY